MPNRALARCHHPFSGRTGAEQFACAGWSGHIQLIRSRHRGRASSSWRTKPSRRTSIWLRSVAVTHGGRCSSVSQAASALAPRSDAAPMEPAPLRVCDAYWGGAAASCAAWTLLCCRSCRCPASACKPQERCPVSEFTLAPQLQHPHPHMQSPLRGSAAAADAPRPLPPAAPGELQGCADCAPHGAAACAAWGPLEDASAASTLLHLPRLQAPHSTPAPPPETLAASATPPAWLAPLPHSALQRWAPPPSPACLPPSSGTCLLASSHMLPAPLPPA